MTRRAARAVGLAGLAAAVLGSALTAQDDLTATVERAVTDVCEKRIVLLGELPSHGEARAFEGKARIVERLVEDCGFGAVLFEAPVYEFVALERALAADRSTPRMLERAMGGFWATRGLSAWRRWLHDEASDGRLVLGGLDDQVSASSDYARVALPDLVARFVPGDTRDACHAAIVRNLNWTYDAENEFDETERDRLDRCAASAARGAAAADPSAAERWMLENLASLYARQAGAADADRDATLAENLGWHMDRLPPGTRAVVWTATVHASRTPTERIPQPLGARSAVRFGDGLASVGFTAYRGASSMAGAPVRTLPEAPPESIEARATADGRASRYLDAEDLRRLGPVPSRLFGGFSEADWADAFDGVVVIRDEVAPVFEPTPREPAAPARVTRITTSGARNGQSSWSPDGSRIAFVSNREDGWQVWIRGVDEDAAVRLTSLSGPAGWPTWSLDGSAVLFYSERPQGYRLSRVDVTTKAVADFGPDYPAFRPSLSPDGGRLLFDAVAPGRANHDIYIQDLRTGETERLTNDEGYESDARWSPDGERIVYHSDRGSDPYDVHVFTMAASGSEPRALTSGDEPNAYPAWSPNGRCIVYTREVDENRDLWLYFADGTPHRLTVHAGFDGDPIWHPRGGSILFTTDRFGGQELALLDVSEPDRTRCEM